MMRLFFDIATQSTHIYMGVLFICKYIYFCNDLYVNQEKSWFDYYCFVHVAGFLFLLYIPHPHLDGNDAKVGQESVLSGSQARARIVL